MSQSAQPHDHPAFTLDEGISLYVHVPFCLSKCPYCDFNTYQGIESQFDDFLTAVMQEITAWSVALGRPTVNTVFLGGGTPSYLPDGEVARILGTIARHYAVRSDAEINRRVQPQRPVSREVRRTPRLRHQPGEHRCAEHGQWSAGDAGPPP